MKKVKKYLLIIPYAISSWLVVHLLAIFGFFVAVAYPIWWAIFPNSTVCFSCRSKKDGKKCKFCNKTVNVHEKSYPHVSNLTSAIKNGLLISIFTVISIGLVFAESYLLKKAGIPRTPKTVSFIIPTTGQYKLGEIFPMKIEIVGIETPINAVQADISFDPQVLEILDISTDESFANVFIQKEIENEAGYARLTGGLPNPGFFSDRGIFGTVMFRGKTPGVVKIEFLPTSMVLANDGRGTNVLKDFASVSYLITPERIDEKEEEMQKQLITMGGRVLGEQKNKTQIKFFDEESVLGINIENETQNEYLENQIGLFEKIGHFIEKIDSFIINLWQKVLGIKN